VGVDSITDFEVDTDKIVLSKTTFTALTSAAGGSLEPSEFEAVTNDGDASTSSAFITYSTSTGNLFYNQREFDGKIGRRKKWNSLIAHIYLYGGIHPPNPLNPVFHLPSLIPLCSIRYSRFQTGIKFIKLRSVWHTKQKL
ncbi:MAG: hypothetical protein AB4372_09085, partial [Xenococcus sp. (in: cyanobacteria)]